MIISTVVSHCQIIIKEKTTTSVHCVDRPIVESTAGVHYNPHSGSTRKRKKIKPSNRANNKREREREERGSGNFFRSPSENER